MVFTILSESAVRDRQDPDYSRERSIYSGNAIHKSESGSFKFKFPLMTFISDLIFTAQKIHTIKLDYIFIHIIIISGSINGGALPSHKFPFPFSHVMAHGYNI